MSAAERVEPFRIAVSDSALADLAARLRAVRWPERETVSDWSQGVPLDYLQELVAYWRERYDWRTREARINRFAQCRVRVGDVAIHCLHVRSQHSDAVPLILTHGWPGSIVEFLNVIDPLTAPEAHGGESADAFHVVCPSLPGYGFSDKPPQRGYGVEKIGELWDELMVALGYEHYFAQGGDWGAAVTTQIGVQNRGRCRGIHLNLPIALPRKDAALDPTPQERVAFAATQHYSAHESGYAVLQSTRPQTIGYALADSPVAQCAWIIEKFKTWTDNDGLPESAVSRDELLDNVMMYWLTGTGASSARLYWESFRASFGPDLPQVTVPTACSQFAKELAKPPREWVERRYPKLVYWNEIPKGGHFAAFEQPALFVDEVRSGFRAMRRALAAGCQDDAPGGAAIEQEPLGAAGLLERVAGRDLRSKAALLVEPEEGSDPVQVAPGLPVFGRTELDTEDVRVAEQRDAQRHRGHARSESDCEIATAARHRAERRLRVRAAHAIVDDVEPIAACQGTKPGRQRLLGIEVERSERVTQRAVGAVPARERELLVRGGGRDDRRTQCLADRDRRDAGAAARADHEQRFPGLQGGALRERVQGRVRSDVEGRGRVEIHRGRDLHDLEIGERDFLGVSAVVAGGEHARALADTCDVRSHSADHTRDFDAGGERRLDLELGSPLCRKHVGEIDSRGSYLDEDLARTRDR